MEEFANKEIEITDKLASLIGGDLVTIEFNTKDKSKLEFLLCANQEEKQKVTKKKVKRFKKEIDNCREEIAGYLLALADIFENGQYYLEQEEITKNFISDYYDDLVKTLAKENNDISNLYDLEDIITSNGYDYQLIVDYIFGVSNMYFYQYYKLCLDTSAENATPESTAKSNNITDDKFSLKQTYSENFSNDPLFDDENEYNVFKNNFIEEYNSKLAAIDIDNSSTYEELKAEFQLWEMTQKENLNTIFLKMIKELNNKKTFFFGCSFSSYEHNYPIRLNQFLENFYDATELEFINDELVFLENILYDIQNSESAHDGYSQSGIRNFLKAYDVISITGYRQYLFSHNKKVEFLEFKKDNLEVVSPKVNQSFDFGLDQSTNPYPQVFPNLKSFQLFQKLFEDFKDSNSKIADFSFIYRKMYDDGYILNHFKPQMFIGWISKEPYCINLDKIKTLNDCNTNQKVKTYTTTKELMQLI